MTAGREDKLLARLDAGARHNDYPEAFGESWPKLCADAAAAIRRLAAKPADDGVREATIEECARVAEQCMDALSIVRKQIAARIRALSTKATKP